ncbi:MAG: CehA/McbA family metallohydrolase [Planctomycetaceae bacterium]|nr:CehA/McbA family metallohydrolase [Planctomycetaceae bacterium]
MRRLVQLLVMFAFLTGVWILQAANAPTTGRLTLALLDARNGQPLAGIVQLRDEQQRLVPLPGLMNRGLGLDHQGPIHDWHVVPAQTTFPLEAGRYTISALHGIETERAEQTVTIERGKTTELQLSLQRFYDAAAKGLYSGNTHLHLMKLPRVEADRYLVDVPKADGLDVLFVSHLERADADRDYVTNQYTREELTKLGERGVPIGNGEEHRHNFAGWGQGYGHVMFLELQKLIHPASIGPGIMKSGTDGRPLQVGIDEARAQGATIIWCHDQWGYEDIPNRISGRLQATNIFDGGTHGSYQHSFYRFLNAGFHVPFSTGTDWFMYDFSRVYVPASQRPTPQAFLDVLVAGRTMITNGPLLELSVEGHGIGTTVDLKQPGQVSVVAQGVGRCDFERLELVRNGVVIEQVQTKPDGGHFVANFNRPIDVTGPCWFAVRTPPPPVKGFADLQTPVNKNELGQDLFAHTSAVYVDVAGRHLFDIPTAEGLLAEMNEHRRIIADQAKFVDENEKQHVLRVYDEAIDRWQARIAEQRKS